MNEEWTESERRMWLRIQTRIRTMEQRRAFWRKVARDVVAAAFVSVAVLGILWAFLGSAP